MSHQREQFYYREETLAWKGQKNISSLTPDPTPAPIKFEELLTPTTFYCQVSIFFFVGLSEYLCIFNSKFTFHPIVVFRGASGYFSSLPLSDKLRPFFAWYAIFIFFFLPFVLWRLVISPHFGGFPCVLRCCYNALEECCWISLLF